MEDGDAVGNRFLDLWLEWVKTRGKQVELPIATSRDPVRVLSKLNSGGHWAWCEASLGLEGTFPLSQDTSKQWKRDTRVVCPLPRGLLTLFVFGFVVWDCREFRGRSLRYAFYFVYFELLYVALPVFVPR